MPEPIDEPTAEAAGEEVSGLSAQDLARGVLRVLAEMDLWGVTEFSLPTGRRVDICALGPDGRLTVVEIKTSVADFRADSKWNEYLDYCELFYFAVPSGFPDGILPAEEGLIVGDRYGAGLVRPAIERPLNAARRRSLTLKFARAAAGRLRRWEDPGFPL